MYKILRIICCVISALLLAGCVFFFVYLGNVWGIVSIVGAGAFFALTILFKSLQEEKQAKESLNKKADEIPVPDGDGQTPTDGKNGEDKD